MFLLYIYFSSLCTRWLVASKKTVSMKGSSMGKTPKDPTTFAELKKSSMWRPTLHLLKQTGKIVMVAEGEACMGSYSAVVLTGRGFQLERGPSGMTAAYSTKALEHTPIRTAKEVAEMAINHSGPMSDDPPGTLPPTESEIVANLLQRLKKIRRAKR